ncbi:MAG: TolC family protein, partial [Deltaproteobacteria bacterium]|nr:TolC family protein [Deltaproteobacteria bacterium]
DLQALRLEESAASGRLEKARLPLGNNPAVESYVSRKDRPQEDGGGAYTNYGFKISQEIEIAGQRGSRISAAQNELAAVRAGIADKERTLTADVKDAFARALALKKKEALAGQVLGLKEEFLGYAKIKYQAGDISALDVNLAEVELSKAKRERLLSQREYQASLLALQSFFGAPPDLSLPLQGELPQNAPVMPDRRTVMNAAMSGRPDAQAASLEMEKTKALLMLAKKEAFPNLTLSGFYDRDELRNVVGVGLSIPFPLFDRKQAEKKEALARREGARIKADGLKQAIEREVEQAVNDLTAAREELTIFNREIIVKSGENLNLLNLAFKEGKVSFFEVRLAQKETMDVQFAYIDAQIRTQLAINALEKITGGALK